MTRLIRGLHNIAPMDQGCVITIGNFDGVHIGHQQLLARLRDRAQAMHAPSLVMTFEPQPLEFFTREQIKVPRLTRLREKFIALSETGVDKVWVLRFDAELAALSAEEFVNQILHKRLNVRHVIVGEDFHFGYQRQGNVDLLQKMGEKLGFKVERMPAVSVEGGRVSSTRLRQALAHFDAHTVQKLLGHPYSMLGRIRYGDQLGRTLGFPTANIHLHRALTPVQGVFAVTVSGLAPQSLPGAANVGMRPTVNGTRTLLEVYLLDFNQDIYGRYVRVEFCEKLREEERYDTLELLKAQITKDVVRTREYFAEKKI